MEEVNESSSDSEAESTYEVEAIHDKRKRFHKGKFAGYEYQVEFEDYPQVKDWEWMDDVLFDCAWLKGMYNKKDKTKKNNDGDGEGDGEGEGEGEGDGNGDGDGDGGGGGDGDGGGGGGGGDSDGRGEGKTVRRTPTAGEARNRYIANKVKEFKTREGREPNGSEYTKIADASFSASETNGRTRKRNQRNK